VITSSAGRPNTSAAIAATIHTIDNAALKRLDTRSDISPLSVKANRLAVTPFGIHGLRHGAAGAQTLFSVRT
jgi:hypothetical protein